MEQSLHLFGDHHKVLLNSVTLPGSQGGVATPGPVTLFKEYFYFQNQNITIIILTFIFFKSNCKNYFITLFIAN